MNKRLREYIGIAIAVTVAVVGIRFAQNFDDWRKLATYQPPAEIERLVRNTGMTETGRKLFYVNNPTIESYKSGLNSCKSTEHTVVLGCYVPSKGIFLQAVTDVRLKGIMEVTAAHEMLHVAFGRMSLLEQNQLGKLLETELEKVTNPRILKLVETYRDQDPKSVNNELHSILGTEVANLSPELEDHYREYFNSRSIVVGYSEQYEGVFSTLRDKTKSLGKQLEARKAVLEQLVTQVENEARIIESERASLQAEIVSNPKDDYNMRVTAFNNRIQYYDRLVAQLKEQTETYNQMVTEHNSLTFEARSLFDSLENKTIQPVTR